MGRFDVGDGAENEGGWVKSVLVVLKAGWSYGVE